MLRIGVVGALWIVCCLGLASCGGGGDGPSSSVSTAAQVEVEQFPQLAVDGSGKVWMTSLVRLGRTEAISVEMVDGERRKQIIRLSPEGSTGLAHPTLAQFGTGIIVAFSVELNKKWLIAYLIIENPNQQSFEIIYLPCAGTVNIAPSVAVNQGRALLVWESNAESNRSIFACSVDQDNIGEVRRISSFSGNSYNPSVVALSNGDFFAAWDAFEDSGSNIYGAWLKPEGWTPVIQVSEDPRIERYPALASWNNEIWLCWQAQSYTGITINSLKEQRIVVAKLEEQGLKAPLGFFEEVSTSERLLLRPQIAFGPSGELWLTARMGMENIHAGWIPVVWTYLDGRWSKIKEISSQQGRWQAVPLVPTPEGDMLTAIQIDNLPQGWDSTRGIFPDWNSTITLTKLMEERDSAEVQFATLPLAMPPTDFSLVKNQELLNSELPRQNWRPGDRDLQLFWGDLHDHTDISVCNRRFNPPGKDLFANLRDIEKLDFAAITDHGFNLDVPQWRFNGEQTRYGHDPGRFITFLAQEWTSNRLSNIGGYGHRNFIFLDPFFDRFFDAFDGDITPRDVWDQLKNVDFITIPHQLADWEGEGWGNPPTDWSFFDEKLQPIAEIYQNRGSYEYLGCPRQAPEGEPVPGNYLQDAWAKGIIIGVMASPDHDGGKGKIGVWAEALDRQTIFQAIRARHTFGTSGPKINLQFNAGEIMMGDKVRRPEGPVIFSVKALAPQEISELVIFRNNQIVFTFSPNRSEFQLDWMDDSPPVSSGLLWYYVRVKTVGNHLAWSSPIWFE